MPIKLRRKFEREYGKKEGRRIFYSWLNKMNKKRLSIKLPKHKVVKKKLRTKEYYPKPINLFGKKSSIKLKRGLL